ncbi:hypothetical protein FRC09_007560 [Ceratobasidium sp. 395]|nr:hypothetical protein FRC09_007560 [Ceratobasidium sp. 395]
MIDRLLGYANAFPSIFGAIQRKRWAADLEKCQLRDTHSNKTQFQALVDAQDRTLVAALEDDALKKDLQTVAQDLGMLEDLYLIMSSSNGTTTSSNHESPHIVASSPQSSAKVPLFTHASPDISTNELHSSARSRQGSLDMIWSTISKLEEHVGGDPAFESQMVQLRKLAQAAMISTDEGVSERAKPSLLKQATVTSSPAVSGPPQPSLQVTLPDQSLKLRVAELTQDSLQIPAEPSLAIQDSRKKHVLEYIKSHPSSDRFRLCLDIGQGLAHMHALGIVLGDFAPWNVTVDESGNVQLRELNLSSSINGRPAGRGTWRSQLPDARYIPPEVITLPPEAEGGTDPNPTKSDVYAFTLLLFEILSGVAPWDKLDIPSIVSQVTRGNRPTRPTPSAWLDDNNVWSLIQLGWHQQPENRPDMASYARNLEGWKHLLPATQNNDPFNLTQLSASPTTEQFLTRKTEDLTIMDDLSFDITREVKMVSELFTKDDIYRLVDALKIPDPFRTSRNRRFSAFDALVILLSRLTYPCRLVDLSTRFYLPEPVLSDCINELACWITNHWASLLLGFNSERLNPAQLDLFASVIAARGCPMDCIWGFIDATIKMVCRPGQDQRELYSGYAKGHCLKYSAVVTPDGIISCCSLPIPGRRADQTCLRKSKLEECLEVHAVGVDGRRLLLWGDPAYMNTEVVASAEKKLGDMPAINRAFFREMATYRQCVEWAFGKISTLFSFNNYSTNLKVLLSPVGSYFLASVLLTNAHTCIYGSETSHFYSLQPPSLEKYFVLPSKLCSIEEFVSKAFEYAE